MRSEAKSACLALVGALPLVAGKAWAEEKLPPLWRKTMTNDPATNPWLARFTEPLGRPTDEAARIMVLVRAVGSLCERAIVNRAAFVRFVERSGLDRLPPSDLREASQRAGARFNGFDYQELAHLCAGADYLFGSGGALAKGLTSGGTGEPKARYDRDNPYIMLPPLAPDGG